MPPMRRFAAAASSALVGRLARPAATTTTKTMTMATTTPAAIVGTARLQQRRALSTGDGGGGSSAEPGAAPTSTFTLTRVAPKPKTPKFKKHTGGEPGSGPEAEPAAEKSAGFRLDSASLRRQIMGAREYQNIIQKIQDDEAAETAGGGDGSGHRYPWQLDTAEGGGPAVDGILQTATYHRSTQKLHLQYQGVDRPLAVSALWLRDACTCPQCVTPSSGQKTFHTHDLPQFPQIETAEVVEGEGGRSTLRLVWAASAPSVSDGSGKTESHVSLFDAQELLYTIAMLAPPLYPGHLDRRLWDRATIEKALKPVSYEDWMAPDDGSNTEFYRALLDLQQLGILVVDGVPESETAVRDIANQIGNVQSTFYGELFDVVSKPDAENVAYTNEFLCLHQDLLYMNDPPHIQLLHCLRNECEGGESLFSDSVRAAVDMQINKANEARALAVHAVHYHYERHGHYYYNSRPVIELQGRRGNVASLANSPIEQTGWSPPFQNSMGFPIEFVANEGEKSSSNTMPAPNDFNAAFVKGTQATRLAYWHTAARHFSELLEHPDNMFEFKLKPGQCVLFNNRRVLHGRRRFNTSGEGTRWLKGAYIDQQTFTSKIIDMVRRGNLPGWLPGRPAQPQTTETAETPPKTKTTSGQPPFGPFPPPFAYRQLGEKAQVLAMLRKSRSASNLLPSQREK